MVPGNTDWTPSSLINEFILILTCCGSLVTVDGEERTIRLVHYSFKKFLVDGFQDHNEGDFLIDLAHKNIADSIITYLSYGVFGTRLSTIVIPRMSGISTIPARSRGDGFRNESKCCIEAIRIQKTAWLRYWQGHHGCARPI
jgi:hypothetical protein